MATGLILLALAAPAAADGFAPGAWQHQTKTISAGGTGPTAQPCQRTDAGAALGQAWRKNGERYGSQK